MNAASSPSSPDAPPARPGRKRDPARDAVILDAALAVLADRGFAGMTIDLVAEHAGMARATVYRRWPTKAELVVDAVSRLSQGDVGHDELPDTGSLRGDLLAMVRPFDDEQQQVRVRAVVGLTAAARSEPRLAEVAAHVGVAPWVAASLALLQRAVDRGEYPAPADLRTLAEVVPMLCLSRAAQGLPITRDWSVALIDGVLLPAMRGG